MLGFKKVDSEKEIKLVSKMAHALFPVDYGSYVRPDHLQHFLTKYQSVEAIQNQINNGSYYYLIQEKSETIGYLGFDIEKDKLLLSKLYFNLDKRGEGHGATTLLWLHDFAAERMLNDLELLVLEENSRAIAFYERNGFEFIDTYEEHFYTGYSETNNRMRKSIKK